MGYSKDDTKNQTPTRNPTLVTDIKRAIELALDEGGWSRIGHSENPKVTISENKRLKGDSGMYWPVNLAVTDGKEKPYMVIYCVDSTASKDFENTLTKAAAACQDLYFMDAPMVLVVRKDKHKKRNSKLLPARYHELFSINHVDVIPWNPKHAFELVAALLHRLRHNHKKMQGIKSVKDAANNLTEKYPDLFADHMQIPKKTDCLELLHQIKEYDPHFHYGEIIKDVLSQEGVCQSLIGSQLSLISDAKLEKLLKQYYQQQE